MQAVAVLCRLMPLNYSFNLIVPAESVDQALAALAAHLHSRDARRIKAALPWSPTRERIELWNGEQCRRASGFAGVQRGQHEVGESLCVSLLLDPDAPALRLEEEGGPPFPRDAGRIAFGCMWTAISVGTKLAAITSTAASSNMSRLCERSEAVQGPWRSIARELPDAFLFLDCEELETWRLLHPCERVVPRPDYELFTVTAADRPVPDPYWADAIEKASRS